MKLEENALFLLSTGHVALFLVAFTGFTPATSRRSRDDDFARICYKTYLPGYAESSAIGKRLGGYSEIQVGPQTCCTSLEQLRAGIDAVDEELLQLLSKRFRSFSLRF